MPKAFLNGVSLYYEDKGAGIGIPLLFLHGLTSSMIEFKKDISYFKEKYRVITLDFRGHGQSTKPSIYTINDHITDVLRLLDYLEIEKVNIIGSSMGSYIAQGVSIQAPNKIHKLILVSPKAEGKTSSTKRLIKKYEDELKPLNLNDDEKFEYLSRYIYYNLDAVEKENKKKGPFLTLEQRTIANKALEGFDFRNDLCRIKAETLVISGRYDGLNPPVHGMEICKLIPKSRIIIFEKSGHNPAIEERNKYLKVIDEFLIR